MKLSFNTLVECQQINRKDIIITNEDTYLVIGDSYKMYLVSLNCGTCYGMGRSMGTSADIKQYIDNSLEENIQRIIKSEKLELKEI
ncbi:hypothetical protein CON64_18560 [Bacillus pseudomycoides]|nr:hypothetical protein CON64_18560 [Bacillus pseudomycoides]